MPSSFFPAESEILKDESLVLKARNDFVSSSQVSAIRIILVYVAIFTVFMYGHTPLVNLITWLCLCTATYISRLYLLRSYRRESESAQASDNWQLLITLLSGASGLAWASAAYIIYPDDSASHQMFLFLTLAIVSAASAVTLSAYRWASASFVVSCLVPAAAKLLFSGEGFEQQIATMLLVFCFLILASAHYLYRFSNRALFLGQDNSRLIQELKRNNERLEQSNLQLKQMKTALRKDNDKLQRLVISDTLTGLANRHACESQIEMKWHRCKMAGQSMSLIMIDLDFFRHYNEFYGRSAGDQALVAVASIIKEVEKSAPNQICCSRYGGDQFAMILADTGALEARELAERCCKSVEALRIPVTELAHNASPWLSVSIGVATASPSNEEESPEALFRRAEFTLQSAKRDGRNMARHECEAS
ncbi:diguanylate cyclase domain-containing protein [Agaribacterium sp. ZY112]|uniref:GGDEF domain-containing protein n=1 Tax=Agaribacterium sp. ZY112 TaxID=3233574 RepID=UPI003523F4E9